ARTGINYRMVIGDEQTAMKYGGVDSLPSTFLIDREGRIAAVHIGLVSKGDYVKDLEQLLGAAK
ncbi:MAG: TlpA family protein disulfide reductase, partial [Acidobacteriota bacterium]